ncbi:MULTISPECIES: DUF2203 domain-containing protein [Salipaludibacillus]|nr:DUF2203 domain-containing protein [Salipaludibacillus neizhouensis]
MITRYFTIKEANELLPTIIKEINELKMLQQDFESKLKKLERVKHSMQLEVRNDTDSLFKMESEIEFIEMQVQLHVNNVQLTGAQLKGIETALVDFPAIHNDEEILLCWKEGESHIAYYHSLQDGYSGRKPLE